MKIVLIGPLPIPINGCSYANQVLLKNFKKNNIDFACIDTNTKIISGKQGTKFSITKAFSFIGTYFKIYRLFGSSVVYITPGQTFFGILKYAPFIFLCRFLRKPYVIHLHGNYLGKEYAMLKGLKKRIFGFLISGASAGIVLSQSLCENFKELLPLHKIHIVENFVDDSLLHIPIIKNDVQLHILYLSNLIREKGILELLDGLIGLIHIGIDFKVTIAGAMEKGIEKEIQTRFDVLSSRVAYVGTVTGNKKISVLSEANIFVLPTYYKMEGQPICLLEAMATGNIIITTAHAGIPDIIDETNGFFIREESADDITARLQTISHNLPSAIRKFSNHNMDYTAERFTEKKFSDKILTILHGVAKA